MAKNNNIQVIEFFPLQKIEVTESTKVYKPGSIGYVTYIGRSPALVQPLTITFMRFGKKGKKRVATETLYYYALDLSKADEESTKILTGPEVHNYHRVTAVLQPAIQETKNLEEMPGYEFVCYAAAFSMYVIHLDVMGNGPMNYALGVRNQRYSLGDTLLFLEDLGRIEDIRSLHPLIISACKMGKVDDRNLLKEIVTFYDVPDNRKRCMEQLYKSLSSHKRAVEKYHKRLSLTKAELLESAKEIIAYERGDKKKGGRPKKARMRLKRAR